MFQKGPFYKIPYLVVKRNDHTKLCICMFIAALFIIVKTFKLPSYFSVGEWINKLWYIQTTEYYSVLKRNELSSHEKNMKEP